MRQPTIGVTLATARARHFGAELGYRRTWSDTVGLIGAIDRLDYPDRRAVPERLRSGAGDRHRRGARVRARARLAARRATLVIEPYGDVRYSLLHAAFDRADAGVRLRRGEHVLEPAVEYFLPTFDGDSIFNVFSLEPTTDVRLGYRYGDRGPWRATAERGCAATRTRTRRRVRRRIVPGGGEAGVQHVLGARLARAARRTLRRLATAGGGGRHGRGRCGANAPDPVAARPRDRAGGRRGPGREHARVAYVTTSANVSTTWRVADSVALHFIAESDHDAIQSLQTRAIAVFDLAFAPEP